MKIKEIVTEGYVDQLHSDLNNILVAARARGITEIPTDDLVLQLTRLGYAVDAASLPSALEDNPMVQSVTPTDVQLKQPDAGNVSLDADAEAQNAETVRQMASDTAEHDIMSKKQT